MAKTKTSKKQKTFSFEEMPIVKLKPGVKTSPHDPAAFFKDKKKVKEALVQCMLENDSEAFIEILQAFYRIHNRSKLAKESGIRRSTMYEAFRPGANPSFKKVLDLAQPLMKT